MRVLVEFQVGYREAMRASSLARATEHRVNAGDQNVEVRAK